MLDPKLPNAKHFTIKMGGRMVEQSDMSVLDQRGREEAAQSSRQGIASFIFSFSFCLNFGKKSFRTDIYRHLRMQKVPSKELGEMV